MIKILTLIVLGLVISACGEKTEEEVTKSSQYDANKLKKLEHHKKPDQDKNEVQIEESNVSNVSNEKIKIDLNNHSINSKDIVLGNPNSSVILIEYFSPTCSHCATFHKSIYPEIKKRYIDTGKIAYIMREFISNKQDLDSTILARCSGEVDNYTKFMKIILEQQSSWMFNKNYREILTNIANLGGISPQKYTLCLQNQETKKILIENTKLVAKTPGVIGTPSFFVNGNLLKQFTLEDISKALDKALARGS